MANLGKGFLRLSNATGIRRFGEQLTWVQEPDIFHMRLTGTFELDEFSKMMSWLKEWATDRPRVFVICDLTQLKNVSLNTRKYSKTQGRATPANAVAVVYGASFAVRVLAEMSMRARRALGMPDVADVVFVSGETEALEEIERRRATP